MTPLHIVLRNLTGVSDLLFSKKTRDEVFLKECVSFVFLIDEDVIYGVSPPHDGSSWSFDILAG